jgi:hypothetical protein
MNVLGFIQGMGCGGADSPPILGKDSRAFAEQPASHAFQHDQWLLNEAAKVLITATLRFVSCVR